MTDRLIEYEGGTPNIIPTDLKLVEGLDHDGLQEVLDYQSIHYHTEPSASHLLPVDHEVAIGPSQVMGSVSRRREEGERERGGREGERRERRREEGERERGGREGERRKRGREEKERERGGREEEERERGGEGESWKTERERREGKE